MGRDVPQFSAAEQCVNMGREGRELVGEGVAIERESPRFVKNFDLCVLEGGMAQDRRTRPICWQPTGAADR